MNVDQAIAKIRQSLGFRTDLGDEAVAALQRAQRELEGAHRSLPLFLIEEDATLTVTAGSHTVAFPTGFIKEVEGQGPTYFDTVYGQVDLLKRPFPEGRNYFAGEDAGRPASYAVRKDSFYIWPEPDTNYTLTMSYYKQDDVLAAGTGTNKWLTVWPELLIGRAGMYLAEDTRNLGKADDAYPIFERMYQKAEAIWAATLAQQEDANMPRAMGMNQ